ncbi:hypothetical protein YC2023_093250 [Brassica napus]
MEQRRDIRCDRCGEGRLLGPKIVVRFDFPPSDLRLLLLANGTCLGKTSPPPWIYHPVQRRSLRRSGLTAEETVCSPVNGDCGSVLVRALMDQVQISLSVLVIAMISRRVRLMLIVFVLGFDRRGLFVCLELFGGLLSRWKVDVRKCVLAAIGGIDRSGMRRLGVFGFRSGGYRTSCRGQRR